MAGLLIYPQSDLELGMGFSRAPDSTVQAAGLGNLAPDTASIALMRDQALRSMGDVAKQAYSGVKAPATTPGAAMADLSQPVSMDAITAPQGRQAQAAEPTFIYNPMTNQMFANGRVFSADDYASAVEAAKTPNAAPPPVGFTGQRLSPRGFEQYISSISANRGLGGNLWQGFQNTIGGLVGGTGRILETTGIAPETGKAIAGFSEKYIEPSQNEQFRSAMIAQRQTPLQNFWDAVVQSTPSLVASMAGGVGGAALLGRGAAATLKAATTADAVASATAALQQARSIGALSGVVATTFPSEVQSLYENASKAKNPDGSPAYNVDDPSVRAQILAAAAGSTAIQSWADHGLVKGLSPLLKTSIGQAAASAVEKSALKNAAGHAAMGAFSEAFAEGTAELIQRATFDPEFRKLLSVNDMKSLAPYIIDKYGMDIALSAGVGAVLGGAVGGVTNLRRAEVTNKPTDLLQTSAKQEAQEEQTTNVPEQVGTAASTDQQLAANWEQAARMGIQQDQLGMAPFGENPAIGDAWLKSLSTGAPVPQGFQYGLPLMGGRQNAPQQGAPLGMFGNLPFQLAPERAAVQPNQQLELPFGGQQMELPLSGAAPQPPARPSTDTAIGAALLRAQEAARAKAEAPTIAAKNRLQKIINENMRQVEAQLAQDAQAEADVRVANLPTAQETTPPSNVPSQMAFPGMGRLKGGTPQTTVAPMVEAQGPSAQLPLFNQYGGPSTVADQLQGPVQPQGPVDLRKGAPNATQSGQEQQGNQQQYQNAGGRLEVQPQDRNVAPQEQKGGGKTGGRNRLKQGAATQGEVTPPKPEGAQAAPVTIQPAFVPAVEQPSVRVEEPLRGVKSSPVFGGAQPAVGERMTTGFGAGTVVADANSASGTANLEAAINDGRARLERMRTSEAGRTMAGEDTTKLQQQIVNAENQLAALEAELLQKQTEVAARNNGTGQFSAADWNTISGAVDTDTGNPITQPMPVGRLRMAISRFVSNLAKPPRIRVYKDQADMARRDPAYYQQALQARKAGDFNSVMAAGYSFGNGEVVIFSDRIANEQHLRFVLAHEAIGHFGMRALLPATKINEVMNKIYDTDSKARDAADAAMAVRGMSKAEAVEEYLADYAAMLDKSVVLRVWHAIKGVLDNIGIQFSDGITRYLLDQSRRYVRTGQTSAVFDPQAVADRYNLIEKGLFDTGRFSHIGQFVGDNERAALVYGDIGGWPTNIADAWERTKAAGLDSLESFDKFKATYLSLKNYRALENPGLRAFDEIMGETSTISMQLKVMTNEMLRTVYDASSDQKDRLSEVLYHARSLASSKVKSLSQLGKTPLYSITDSGEFVLNEAEARRLIDQGSITFDQMKNGFEWTVTYEGLDGKPVTETRKFAGYKNITENSIEWTGYKKIREAMAEIELRLLRARYADEVGERQLTYKELGVLMSDQKMSKADEAFVSDMVKKYKELYTSNLKLDDRGYPVFDAESMQRGNDFIVALNTSIQGLAGDKSRSEVLAFFDKNTDRVGAQLDDFKSRVVVSDADKFLLQNKIKQLVLSELSNNDAELYTKRTLATGYLPVLRSGDYEVRVEARNAETGKRVTLKDSHKQMLTYSQFDKASDAQSMAKGVDDAFMVDGKRSVYEVLAFDEAQRQYVRTKVTLHARSGAALDAVSVAPELNLNDFIRGLRQFDISITPAKMERIVTSLTKQNASARNRLEFSGTPGYDTKSGIYALSRHIESRSSTIAKTTTRSRLRELMNLNIPESARLWHGDVETVMKMREKLDAVSADPKASPDSVAAARRDLDKAMYMYVKTNPEAKGWDGKRDTFAQYDIGTGIPEKGMQYYNEAAGALSFLEGNRFVDESDFGSGPVASAVRSYTSMVQLGGSIAQGALNFLSVGTNWLPYMASYNKDNSFGGGFGLGKAMSEFTKATMQVGGPGVNMLTERGRAFNTAEFYEAMSKNPAALKEHGLQKHEAEFLAREIREGKMIPAQSNALIGTARGRITNNYLRRFADTFMAPFNLSEQAVRRAAGLAAYRMSYDRAIASGKSEQAAMREARDFAVNSIDLTLGEYSVLNRPAAWRDGIQSFLYMYKVYPTTTIQLFSNLSRNGKIGMLGALWAVSGAMGLPFAEDLEDLVDTLSQALGFKSGSIRAELTKELENIFPGMSDLFLKGLVHRFLPIPADVASRAGVGNVLPATGLLLAGANSAQELKDLIGPAPSMLINLATTVKDLVSVPFSARKSLEDVARESPITLLRAMGDVSAYLHAGAVVDRRGYVVSTGMDTGTVLARLMGFYPQQAADQYEMVRVSKRIIDYQKDVSLGFKQAWVKAMIRGDTNEAAQVMEAVNQWNQGTRGTALEITKFGASAQRALREATRPAGERALKSAPNAAKAEMRSLYDAMLGD